MAIVEITRKQLELLQGFYAHCWNVYHADVAQGFAFWAEQLDAAQVPWTVQNSVSVAAETRSTIGKYLTTILKERGVIVI